MKKGKFVVIYGINNLGKTTQAKILVDKLNSVGRKAKYLKYAIYNLDPSGPLLDEYLRKGNPWRFSPREFQIIQALNRAQYEPALRSNLEDGIYIVAEDYWETGVAWGMGAGVDKGFLLKLNQYFLKEDLALLFVGKRFTPGLENNHKHETDEELTSKVETAHRELAEEFGWKIIDANQTIEEVSKQVWNYVAEIL